MIILRWTHSGFRQSYKNRATCVPAEYKYLFTNCRYSQPTRPPPQHNDRQGKHCTVTAYPRYSYACFVYINALAPRGPPLPAPVPASLILLPTQVLLLVALVAAAAAEGPTRSYNVSIALLLSPKGPRPTV